MLSCSTCTLPTAPALDRCRRPGPDLRLEVPRAICKTMRIVFSLLMAFALLLAPLGMRGGEAMAMPAGADSQMGPMGGHCSKPVQPAGDHKSSKPMLDCMSMCSAIAAPGSPMTAPVLLAAMPHTVVGAAMLVGSTPERDPPPPRFS